MDLGLPLRLAAEPVVREALGPSSRVIGADGLTPLVFIENGLVACVFEKPLPPHEAAQLTGLPPADVPPLSLVRQGKSVVWVWEGRQLPPGPQAKQQIAAAAAKVARLTDAIAELTVRTIQRYYAVQVLEPSTRGFLSILEKTFTRADLYLFEILQNAVDDGAGHIRFEVAPKGLAVCHNGRRFNALDVLGLSSVGLSTKGDGQKRTIGFMGIGFKAVYKRFARVLVHDGRWRFSYEEPAGHKGGVGAGAVAPGAANYGWVLQPKWEQLPNLWDPPSAASPKSEWCHFQLERGRDGPEGVKKDLAMLPETVPPLLGRQALNNFARRGAEKLGKLAPTALTPKEIDAVQYWWQEVHRQHGYITEDLAKHVFPGMVQALKKAGNWGTKDKVMEEFRGKLPSMLEQSMERPELVKDWGWRYIDDHGRVQGPFPASLLRTWFGQGQLKKGLRICGYGMGEFLPMEEVFGEKEAFVSPGLPPVNFQLIWGNKAHGINLVGKKTLDGGYAEEVRMSIRTKMPPSERSQRLLFLIHTYKPTAEARKAYEKHTKREQFGDEEVCLFFQLDEEGNPKAAEAQTYDKNMRGAVHAVLPTELKLPVGAHLQASWLLSVDRQRLQDFSDNAWNRTLLYCLPDLLVLYLKWVAQENPKDLILAYKVLPPMDWAKNGDLTTKALGQDMSCKTVITAIKASALVPASQKDGSVAFAKAQDAMWLPPSFSELLSPEFLHSWLGCAPVAAAHIGITVWHNLWGSCRPLNQQLLHQRRQALATAVKAHEQPQVAAVLLLTAMSRWADYGKEDAMSGWSNTSWKKNPRQGGGGGWNNKGWNNNQKWKEKGSGHQACNPADDDEEDVVEKRIADAWRKTLPDALQWPIFWTEKEQMVTLKEIQWPDESWAKLPKDMREFLENSVTSASTHKIHPMLLPLTENLPLTQGRSIAPQKPIDIKGVVAADAQAARRWLMQVRRLVPNTSVSITDAITKKMQEWTKESLRPLGVQASSKAQIVAVTRWAMENNEMGLITHALVEEGKVTKLKKVSELLVRSEELTNIERLSKVSLPFISTAYEAKDAQEQASWDAFWLKSGAKVGLAFVATSSNSHPADLKWLPDSKIPQLQSHWKNTSLPYGLGKLDGNVAKVVDVQLSSLWTSVLEGIAKNAAENKDAYDLAPSLAKQISQIIPDIVGGKPQLVPPGTAATTTTIVQAGGGSPGKIAPKAAPQGKSDSTPAAGPQPIKTGGTPLENAKPPAARRLWYIPRNCNKEETKQLGVAMWLRQFSDVRWVPGREGDGPDAKRGLYRPCEVLLEPGKEEADSSIGGLPVAQLPSDIMTKLKSKLFEGLFPWGTVAPEPPVDRLVSVATGKSSEPVEPLWRAIVRAHKMGGLKPAHQSRLKTLLDMAVFPPGPQGLVDESERVGLTRLVAYTEDMSDEDKEVTKALIGARWLVDVRANSWCLRDILDGILEIAPIETKVTSSHAGAFLKWCSSAEPQYPQEFADAFTHSLDCILQEAKIKLKVLLPKAALRKLAPSLKVYCKEGPGLGKDRFPGRWLPAWEKGPGGVRPILNDDNSKASMLTPKHGFQILGVLDHPEGKPGTATARLYSKSGALLEILGIQRLSNSGMKLQTRIDGKIRESSASARLNVVLRLLWKTAEQTKPMDENMQQIKLLHCEGITRVLSFTGSKTTETEIFAVWRHETGRDGDDSDQLAIIVASDPEDYAAELEEILLQKFERELSACAARPTKVLRLLRHLESDKKFNKFVSRDFEGFLEEDQEELKRLAEAREAEERAREEAERKAEEERLEAERLAEAERLEAERLAEEERLEAEREAEEERLEAERKAEEERKEAEKIAEEERREAEEEEKRLREEKEAEEAKQKAEEDEARREEAAARMARWQASRAQHLKQQGIVDSEEEEEDEGEEDDLDAQLARLRQENSSLKANAGINQDEDAEWQRQETEKALGFQREVDEASQREEEARERAAKRQRVTEEAIAKERAAAEEIERLEKEAEEARIREEEEADRRQQEAEEASRREEEARAEAERQQKEAEEAARREQEAQEEVDRLRQEAEEAAQRDQEEAERRQRETEEAEERERQAKEEVEKRQREAEEAARREQKAKEEAERRMKEAEEAARREQQEKEEAERRQKEAEEAARKEREAKAEAERLKKEAESAEQKEREAAEKRQREAEAAAKRAQQQKEEADRRQKEAEEAAEKETREKEEADRRQREAEEAAKREKEAKEEADRLQKEAEEAARKEREHREEQERVAQETARREKAAKEEAERRQKAAEESARQEREAKEEVDRRQKEAEETARREKEEMERQRKEAEEAARREREEKEEAERRKKEAEEAARRAQAEKEEAEQRQKEAEETAKREQQEKEKAERRQKEAEEIAKREQEERARLETERKEKELEIQQQKEAELKQKEEEAAKRKKIEQERKDAEEAKRKQLEKEHKEAEEARRKEQEKKRKDAEEARQKEEEQKQKRKREEEEAQGGDDGEIASPPEEETLEEQLARLRNENLVLKAREQKDEDEEEEEEEEQAPVVKKARTVDQKLASESDTLASTSKREMEDVREEGKGMKKGKKQRIDVPEPPAEFAEPVIHDAELPEIPPLLEDPPGVEKSAEEETLDEQLARLRREKAQLVEKEKNATGTAAPTPIKPIVDKQPLGDLEAELARLRDENDELRLEDLRKENETLKKQLTGAAAQFPVSCGELAEEDIGPAIKTKKKSKKQQEAEDKKELDAQEKARKELLDKPISEGFGFRMLAMMGWKEGEGLGKASNGIADPLWLEPRKQGEGIAAEEEEYLPKDASKGKDKKNQSDQGEIVVRDFVKEGGDITEEAEQASRPPPTAPQVLSALLDLMVRQARAQGRGGGQIPMDATLSAESVAEVLQAALSSGSPEHFLQLVDEKLGARAAAAIAELRKAPRLIRWGASKHEKLLLPLWDLTCHHIENATK